MNQTWKAVVGVVLIFIFGAVSGGLCASLIIHHRNLVLIRGGPAALAQLFERRLTRNLHLDATQQQQIDDAVMKNLAGRRDLQKTIQPQIRALNQQTLAEMNAVLKPDQQQMLRENLAEFHQRFGPNLFNPYANDQAAGAATNSSVGQPPSGP